MVRIVLVDDHEVVRRGIRLMLEAHPDWQVCGEAANGREAVKLAAQLKPDIVIVDLEMPELNGLEATRQIKKELPNVEVLIYTMHESEELIREMLLAEGKGNKEVASALYISVKTAEAHRAAIMRKLKISSIVDLVHYAIRNNLVKP
jgi:DNA-binding NarL/FixJ family response regulator